jgi:hypothetical protein
VDFLQFAEEVATVSLGAGDFHQVEHMVGLPLCVASCGRRPIPRNERHRSQSEWAHNADAKRRGKDATAANA